MGEWLAQWLYILMAICLVSHCLNKCGEESSDDDENNVNNSNVETGNTLAEPRSIVIKENHLDLIRSRLMFQQLLSLPSSQDNNKSGDLEMIERTSASDNIEGGHSIGDGAAGSSDVKIESSTSISNIRSSLFSSLVFFNDPNAEDGPDDEQARAAAKSVRHQDCCSICLEKYVVGDVVAQLKPTLNPSAIKPSNPDASRTMNNDDDPNNCLHCFHEDCILEWLQNHDDCPLCRVNIINSGCDEEQGDQ